MTFHLTSNPSKSKGVKINSKRIKRRKREIKASDMRFIETMGTCCWEIRSKHPNGGSQKHLQTVDTHDIPFNIKSIKIKKC